MTKRTENHRAFLGLLVALAACGDSGTTTTTTNSTGDASSNSTASATSGSTASTTTAAPTTGGSSSDSSVATEAPGSTTEAATGSTGGASTGGEPSPLSEYCDCLLTNCHDPYHAKFGEDHEAAEMMCLAYAGSVPSVGMPAMTGDSIECYYWACTQSDCEGAFGGGACQ